MARFIHEVVCVYVCVGFRLRITHFSSTKRIDFAFVVIRPSLAQVY